MRVFRVHLPICRLQNRQATHATNQLFLKEIRYVQKKEIALSNTQLSVTILVLQNTFLQQFFLPAESPCRHLVQAKLEVFSSRSRQSASKKNSSARLKTARKGPSVFATRHRIRRSGAG